MQASAEPRPIAAERLLAWYDRHARALPWRAPPGAPAADPYRVWLSEVMLQQTTVAAVTPRFLRFVARWPTIEALAAAADDEVMAEWAGLGYYRRARNLILCAREVAGRGGFPDDEAGLRRLPGIGAYTAAAIAAIAFGQSVAVIDGNVERVVSRLFALGEPGAGKAIRAAAARLTPPQRPGDFAQAMMDLGATVCTPRAPRCPACPLAADCRGRDIGEPERFPAKLAKPTRPLRHGRAFWIERDGAVWLVRRPAAGMLGGMRALPDDGWSAAADGDRAPPLSARWLSAGRVEHGFTHFRLVLELLVAGDSDLASGGPGTGEWWPRERLEQAGLPTLFARAARLALSAVPTTLAVEPQPALALARAS
jgi:A/G-specific adenine glycosylase